MIIVILILICGAFIFWLLRRHDKTVITCLPTPTNKAILERCSTIHIYDSIPIWGLNGHVQSYFASQIRKGPTYTFRREVLKNRHGGDFGIDWFFDGDVEDSAPIVTILPGIAGHVGNDYIKNYIHYCKENNLRVVSWNWPGCGDGNKLTHPIMRTLGDWTDLDAMFNHIHKTHPNSKIYAVGFSLGANLLLRYLGEVGQATPIVASIAMSAGYCGRTGFHILRKNKMYSRVLAKKWLQVIKDNAEVYKDTSVSIEELESKVKTLEDLDRFFSMKLFGEQYPQIEDYYSAHSSLPYLERIAKPTLLLNSLDDPIVHSELVDLAKKAVLINPNLILAHTKYGGHMGWVQSSIVRPKEMLWMDRVAIEFVMAAHSVCN